jgi:aminocarboxymuconate-semialdehyde decarboxylase
MSIFLPLAMLKIDMHTHLLPEHIPDFSAEFGYGGFIRLHHHKKGAARMMKGETFFREIQENCWNPELRINEYAQFHTQVQVVCTVPVMFSYWAKPNDTLRVASFLNDHLAQIQSQYPKHYVGLGTLPMQDANLAIQELRRLKEELGLPGIQIGSNINDINLGDDRLFPIFEACADLGMAVLVHPWNMMGQEHMSKYWLPWLVGMPAETARAAASMVFSGMFERLPDLRVCFAHAGGSFIPTIGRLEHGFHCRPDLVAIDNPINPRDSFGRFWVDSITHDAELTRYILDKIGPEKMMLGSDYPFPLGDLEIGAYLESMPLSEKEKALLYHGSVLNWLNLSADSFAL